MNGLVAISAVILLSVIAYCVIDKLSKKAEQEKKKKKREAYINMKYRQLNTLQNNIYKSYDKYRNKAILYEDLNSVTQLDQQIDALNELILDFNDALQEIQYYEDLLKYLDLLYDKMSQVQRHTQAVFSKIKDLREYHHGTAEEQAEFKKKQEAIKARHQIPFKDSEFFRGCGDKKSLTSKYHMLVKVYHPDNGGDQKKFIQMKEEYKKCVSQIEQG